MGRALGVAVLGVTGYLDCPREGRATKEERDIEWQSTE
jgi:hypothetical protein